MKLQIGEFVIDQYITDWSVRITIKTYRDIKKAEVSFRRDGQIEIRIGDYRKRLTKMSLWIKEYVEPYKEIILNNPNKTCGRIFPSIGNEIVTTLVKLL